jgi:DNA-binding PadR family transcriptional regulator
MSATDTSDGEAAADAETTEFVAESSRRTAVLERLVTGPAAASEIATRDVSNIEGVRGVSATLSTGETESTVERLRDRGLVELLVDGDTRVYTLTAKGERILFALEWNESN